MNPQINLDKNKRYLLACSFGPDSMSLFHLLLNGGYDFEVAHVNYGLREEAKQETENLLSFCDTNNIKCHVLKVTVDKKKNVEEECRLIRYSFFKELFDKFKFDYVLVAHNQDDLLETYLMQKQRNIYANHYGIADNVDLFGVQVIRPLLNYKKSDLNIYCDETKTPYCIDSSNLSDDYLRNRIRHNVIEKMTNEDREKLLREINDKNIERENLNIRLSNIDFSNVSQLLSLKENELCIAFNNLLKSLDAKLSLSSGCCSEIRNILLSNKPNIEFKINDNVSFVKEYNKCKFVSNKKEAQYHFIVEKPDILDTDYFCFDLTNNLAKRNLKEDDFPIVIRTYQPGDQLIIKDYSVSVRRLFIDWKMPISTRKTWPIIVDKWGIIKYIPRFRTNFDIENSPDFFVKK